MLKFIQDQILGMKWLETPAYELSTKRQDRHNRFCFLFFPGGYTRTSAADSGATAQYAYSFKGWL